ncbi:MAG TPA: AEC family transporter [Thermomicrobiales bacterium]|nr:AEC family transporter [Thermomicrobiales bacterium]
MNEILNATVPVFALILVGYVCGARGILGAGAVDALNRFVMYLALPALLFQAMAASKLSDLANPGLLLAFGGGVIVTFAISFAFDMRRYGHLTTASIDGLAASYPNVGFMGAPLCLIVFGEKSLVPVALAAFVTICLLMTVSIVIIELDRSENSIALWPTVRPILWNLAKNPLVFAPLLGLAVSALGLNVPSAFDRTFNLLGDASSPCALVAIGLFLAEQQVLGDRITVGRIVGLKLLVQPVVTAFIVLVLFPTTAIWSHAIILLSALPVGTGPFMLAKMYDQEPAVASRSILLSTIGSLVTISALIVLFEHA